MQEFFEKTAWLMEKPASYGAFHLVATVILMALVFFCAYRLKNANEKQNRIILFSVSGFLLLTEVYKILFHIYVNPYNWGFFGCFPFQLCSVPMYLSLFCAFCKNKKTNAWLYEFMFSVNMFGGIMAFIEPSGINHGYLTLTLHAYIWHALLIFLGLYLYLSKRVCLDIASYKKGIISYYVACIVAQAFNIIFKGKVNCFYISPFVQSPLAVFKNIYASCGWLANMLLLMLGITIASAFVYYLGYFIRIKTRKTE